MAKLRRIIGAGVVLTGLAIGLPYYCAYTEYADYPGYDDDTQKGRTRNGVAAVVAGVLAQRLYGTTEFNLEVEKSFYPDATVKGNTTTDSIDSLVDLLTTSSHFTAKKNDKGYFEGEVAKSEFNWGVKQISDSKYQVGRVFFKFDSELELDCKDGKINGNYKRVLAFDWPIHGIYDKEGNINVRVDTPPLNFGITIAGKIRKK